MEKIMLTVVNFVFQQVDVVLSGGQEFLPDYGEGMEHITYDGQRYGTKASSMETDKGCVTSI